MTSSQSSRYFILMSALLLAGCSSSQKVVRRLSPIPENSVSPQVCKLITVVNGSPAQKSGIKEGDTIQKVNGAIPATAAQIADLIAKSPDIADLEVLSPGSTKPRSVKVALNKERPRLGAMCDLSGYRKPGVTVAGNESVTIFEDAYATTFSGIIDKGLMFVRVRMANNGSQPLTAGPENVRATDATGQAITLMSPKEVMCYLYGEKGAHLLELKRKKVHTLDSDTAPKTEPPATRQCDGIAMAGEEADVDEQYAEANAEYIATESLWGGQVAPGQSADGLVYLREPGILPVNFKAEFSSRTFSASLGAPQAQETVMTEGNLLKFFETQKKGAPLRVTLKKGKVFVGKFSSWDAVEERVWFDTPSTGLFNTTSFPLKAIRSAELLEQVPAKAAPVNDQSE